VTIYCISKEINETKSNVFVLLKSFLKLFEKGLRRNSLCMKFFRAAV